MSMTTPLLVRLPDELARRFRRSVAPRQRSKFIQRLLEDNLPPEDQGSEDPLYQLALSVEADAELAAAMDEWEAAANADGLSDIRADGKPKRATGA
jgi:hypothetical protein